ncbi:MAG: hypothetical protein QOG65_3653 [Actinomycetota bacterium]|nr:hypothetical protein [Actinomycetota bacterium]
MVVRRHLRTRALVILGISALLLAACGGGGGSKPAAAPSDSTAPGGVTTTTGGDTGGSGNGKCFTDPGPQKARVRFVNLFTNATYPSGDIDVWQGFSGADSCGKKLATVPFGTASDYMEVTAADPSGNWSTIAFVAGSRADDHQIITQTETWKGGEQVTIVFQAQDPKSGNGPASGADQTFFESHSDVNHTLDAVPGKALIAIGAASIQYVVPDGAWRAGIAGGAGCLKTATDTDNTSTSIGGTSQVPYAVTPGALQLSLYPSQPGTCTGKADYGPVTIDAAAGSRTFVFAYGPDAQNIKLLVLPIAT